ncbi:hypothetical protein [Luteibacter sp.]|jgi:hypothetical protein|uniref:hypothetical protein n=1 Tax=Luteibacter sp. TaxID=1886636 RepID=UPI002F3E2FBD
MRTTVVAFLALVAVLLYVASNWWEKAWGTYAFSETSPDGCIRVDTFDPYWVLPSLFHPIPHPDPEARPLWLASWEAPVFRRAYEASTGKFLGETIVYEPPVAFDGYDWGDVRSVGRRDIAVNGFPLATTDRCADEATLKRLGDYYEKRREKHRLWWEKLQPELDRRQREREAAQNQQHDAQTDRQAHRQRLEP